MLEPLLPTITWIELGMSNMNGVGEMGGMGDMGGLVNINGDGGGGYGIVFEMWGRFKNGKYYTLY